ncbi:MAG: putative transporter, partial [Candidatus Omnitrophica bacterium]|nr:putative transporter [Candidatus Omnitrophota bacterium]
LGIMIGSVSLFGIKLGIAGVLFSGIIFGHFQFGVNQHILEFSRELGLILFVYSIGIQVGPGFFSSLKKSGLKLNLLAVCIVLCGFGITAVYIVTGFIPVASAVGLFSGATTNTPSLGAAQQTLAMMPNLPEQAQQLPGLAYSMAYPFGIVGIILAMLLCKFIFKIDLKTEQSNFEKFQIENTPPLISLDFCVENPNVNGVRIRDLPLLKEDNIIISRVMHADVVSLAKPDTVLHFQDIVHAVGPKNKLKNLLILIGSQSAVSLKTDVSSPVVSRKIIVTQGKVVGKSIKEINLSGFSDVTVTRINRADVEIIATPDLEIQFADTLIVVGEEAALDRMSRVLGNIPKELGTVHLMPVFIGIAVGILIGSVPIQLPGIPVPVRLGLAGGPLLAAICLSRLGHIGPVIWYLPKSANFMLREFGIGLFLACVGLSSGRNFLHTLIAGDGLSWIGAGALITFLPLLITALIARIWLKLNYFSICGLLAGSMTDPPALAFANAQSKTNAVSLAYATVYPLVMILRVVAAQILVILFI